MSAGASGAYAIRTEQLTKYYGKNRGIEGLDLEVREGEFFGFIGPNGAGKSTAIRTLLGLIFPTSGRAEMLGMDVAKHREEILASVGYLPSETAFYSGMKVQDLLKWSADLRGVDCSARAAELCERLQLDPTRKIKELSFGNKKKVGIVCALQHDPRLLVLDEPTGGLDPLMQHEFYTILQERHRQGTTVFLSGHILSEIQRNCDRAAIIRDGRVVACDSVEHLLRAGEKRVTVRGRVDLSGLENKRDLHAEGDVIRFLYSGTMSRLVETLAAGQLDDLTVAEPDLDEIVMRYYQKEDGEK